MPLSLVDCTSPPERELAVLARVETGVGKAARSCECRPADAGESVNSLTNVRRREWVQRLFPLGYLDTVQPGDGAFAQAIARFTADLNDWDGARAAATFDAAQDDQLSPGFLPGPALTSLADSLVTFEDEAVLSAMPPRGATGIAARLLHYRLRCLQLYFGPVVAPVSDETYLSLTRLSVLLGLAKGTEAEADVLLPALRLSGDARGMMYRLCDALVLTNHDANRCFHDIVVIHDPTRLYDRRAEFSTVIASEDGFAGTDWLSRQFGFDPKAELGISRKENVEDFAGQPRNQLAIALLQIALWGSGFYMGRLDGWYGNLLNDALVTAVDRQGDGMGPFRIELGEGYFALNLPAITPLLLGARERPEPVLGAEVQYVEDFLARNGGPTDESAIADRVKGFIDGAAEAGRQVLTGVRGLLRRVVAGIKHGVRWAWDHVESLADPVIAVFRTMTQAVKDALALIRRAMQAVGHFWLGRSVVTVDRGARKPVRVVALSRFNRDCDLVHWVAPGTAKHEAEWHARRCASLVAALDTVMVIAVKAIKLGMALMRAATPWGWLRLGLSVLALFRELMRRSLAMPVAGLSV